MAAGGRIRAISLAVPFVVAGVAGPLLTHTGGTAVAQTPGPASTAPVQTTVLGQPEQPEQPETAPTTEGLPLAPPAPASPAVVQIYLRDCAVCHGSDGRGTNRGPNLVGVGRAFTDYMLSTGRMPIATPDEVTRHRQAFYPPDVIRQLVDYVASFGPGGLDMPDVNPKDGNVAEGGELYRLQCAACHAWAGDGGALFQREAPPLHDLTPREVAEAVRVGPDGMPAFGQAAVSDHQINSLVAYVLSLGSLRNRGGQPLWHLGPLVEGGVALFVGAPVLWLVIRRIGGHE